VKLEQAELQVTQRADRYSQIGNPKSPSSRRTVPLSPDVVKALKEWRLAQGGGQTLVFATRRGAAETHSSMMRSLRPVMRDAGLLIKDKSGRLKAKYAPHAFRHLFCKLVHLSGESRWSRSVTEGRAGMARSFQNRDDARRVRPPLPRNRPHRTELATSTASVLQG